jgi:hypothetical protein
MPLFQIFKIQVLSTLKANQSVFIFLDQDIVFVYSRQAGDYYPLQGLQVWNPNMKHIQEILILTTIQPPVGPLEVISGSRHPD